MQGNSDDESRLPSTTFNNFGVEEFFIITSAEGETMTVYLEYAFLENLILDGLLLYLAIKCARTKLSVIRLLLASALGAGEAILFPLFNLPSFAALIVKLSGGALIALIAVKERNLKVHLVVMSAFFGLTFLLGGLLIAVYSAFGISYLPGQGYLLESMPVALLLSLAAAFTIVCARCCCGFYRYRKRRQNLFPCNICTGGQELVLQGYADSGNRLTFRGKPVCVISAVGALKLFRDQEPVGRMTIKTVNGSREMPVFTCEKLIVNKIEHRDVPITVGEVPSKEHSLILHTELVEDRHESAKLFKSVAEKASGE